VDVKVIDIMKVAIVGSSRLDEKEREDARAVIEFIIKEFVPAWGEVITGDANGVDELVRSFGTECNCLTVVKAKNKRWLPHGCKERNETIGQMADCVFSIATKKIKDKRCYHCDEQNHDRTGGCWTRRYALDKLGKGGETILI